MRIADARVASRVHTDALQGNTEQAQLGLIQSMCGGISQKTWPGVEHLPYFNRLTLTPNQPRTLREKIIKWERDENALQMLDSLLTLNPNDRISADKALQAKFLWSEVSVSESEEEREAVIQRRLNVFIAKKAKYSGSKAKKKID